ncbi:hypothetical protein [Polluticoccus soli]|nr:hypothetical protein [Flavipsychrobacter sp. JY13-12]
MKNTKPIHPALRLHLALNAAWLRQQNRKSMTKAETFAINT